MMPEGLRVGLYRFLLSNEKKKNTGTSNSLMIFSEMSAPSHLPTAPCSACVPCCGNHSVCKSTVGCALFFSISCPGVITPHLPCWAQVQPATWGRRWDTVDFSSPMPPLALTLLSSKPESFEPFMTESGRKKKDLTLQVNLAFALGVLSPWVMSEALSHTGHCQHLLRSPNAPFWLQHFSLGVPVLHWLVHGPILRLELPFGLQSLGYWPLLASFRKPP